MLKELAVLGLGLIGALVSSAATSAQTNTCIFQEEKARYLAKHPAFFIAQRALDELEDSKLPGKEEFSFDPQQQEPMKNEAKRLFSEARTSYAKLLGQIVSQQSQACLVCSLKSTY